jgi:hypothetical protein
LARRLLKTLHETAGLACEHSDEFAAALVPDVADELVTADASAREPSWAESN